MDFEGYRRGGPVGRRGVVIVLMVGAALFALWVVLAFGAMPATVRDWLWVLWFAASGWSTFRLERPQRQRWGHGTLEQDTVTWEGAETFTGRLVNRSDIGPIANGWVPRVMFPVLLLWELAMKPHALLGQLSMAIMALAVIFAWQSWVRPLYRTELTVETEDGRRRIRVVRIDEARREVPS